MICILSAGKTLILAASAFTLSWTHSVEKTLWEESWIAGPEGLTVIEGRVAGSGAGMEPPEGAVREGGAYVYRPTVPAIPELVLAASGATGSGWTLCPANPSGGSCLTLGEQRGPPVVVRWCDSPLGSEPVRR